MTRVALIVPVGDMAAASANLGTVLDGAGANLSVPLSATGDGPATYMGGCGIVDDPEVAALFALVIAYPGSRYWRWDDADHLLDMSWSGSDAIGTAWNWAKCLTSANLLRVTP